MDIKSFNKFTSEKVDIFGESQVGPVKIQGSKPHNNGFVVSTNLGDFFISKDTYNDMRVENDTLVKPHTGYSYVLDVDSGSIVDIAMSTVDLLIFYKNSGKLQLLAIKRGHPPFVGSWANPGGNIDEGETPIEAAVRELEEETNIKILPNELTFIGKFDKPWRDPRNKICVSYAFACVVTEKPIATAQDDADDVTWLDIDGDAITNNGEVVTMAFDHSDIVKVALANTQFVS